MTDQRSKTLAAIDAFGLVGVPIREGAKAPMADWDARTVITSKESIELVRDAPGVAFHVFGPIVDVDLDNHDPLVIAALDALLPQPIGVWGRPGKPRSHRLYKLPDDFDREPHSERLRVFKSLKVGEKSLSVELRGGTRSSAMVSVAPGSIHPDTGEPYTWDVLDTSASPPVVELPDLLNAMGQALSAAILARYWQSGLRNDMAMALAGMLWRMQSVVASIAEQEGRDIPPSDEAAARGEALLRAVMELAEDDPSDARDRVRSFHNTWRKLDRDPGAKVTGGARMAELIGEDGQSIVRTLHLLSGADSGMLAFDAIAADFRIWYGQGVLIDLDLVRRGVTTFWMTKEQAKNSMGNRAVRFGPNKIPLAPLLFSSSAVGRVFGVTFDPSTTDLVVETEMGPQVNQWRGFRIKPHPQPVADADVRPFLDYVFGVVANGDEKAYRWVMSWCADILQAPGSKPGTCLVLVGEQGAGKTFLGECVLGPILGPTHFGQTNAVSSITDRFNQLVDNKLVVQCDEAVHSYQRDMSARLKALITDQTVKIEPKYVNAYSKPNHMRFIFTSNEETAALFLDPTPSERRFTVLKVSSTRANDVEYWRDFRAWMEENLPKVMRWLLDFKYSRTLITRPYGTEAKRMLQGVGVPLEVSWLVERVKQGFPLAPENYHSWWQAFVLEREATHEGSNLLIADTWPDIVHLPSLEEDYRLFIRARGKQVHTGNAWVSIKPLFPDGTIEPAIQRSVTTFDAKTATNHKRRVRLYSFPPRQAIVDHLYRRYGDVFGVNLNEPDRPDDHGPHGPPRNDLKL